MFGIASGNQDRWGVKGLQGSTPGHRGRTGRVIDEAHAINDRDLLQAMRHTAKLCYSSRNDIVIDTKQLSRCRGKQYVLQIMPPYQRRLCETKRAYLARAARKTSAAFQAGEPGLCVRLLT